MRWSRNEAMLRVSNADISLVSVNSFGLIISWFFYLFHFFFIIGGKYFESHHNPDSRLPVNIARANDGSLARPDVGHTDGVYRDRGSPGHTRGFLAAAL